MKVNGKPYRSVWLEDQKLCLIDQTRLPWTFEVLHLSTVQQVIDAIVTMQVRGAPAIGIAAAYGMFLAALEASEAKDPLVTIAELSSRLVAARPTAVNLAWAVAQQMECLKSAECPSDWPALLRENAQSMAERDVETCRQIGIHGLELIRQIAEKNPDRPVNVLTHCNAGWLACVDYGTITAPIYLAHDQGVRVHVWVSETRPRNQGALLTAWELAQHGVPHTVIADNASGYLMQHGEIDLVFVGTDRTTVGGDVANKIGTYMKAVCAMASKIPFYVAAPSSSIDFHLEQGSEIEIEQRSADEVLCAAVKVGSLLQRGFVVPEGTPVFNPAFDVTPRELVSGLITERGVCRAEREELLRLFPERLT